MGLGKRAKPRLRAGGALAAAAADTLVGPPAPARHGLAPSQAALLGEASSKGSVLSSVLGGSNEIIPTSGGSSPQIQRHFAIDAWVRARLEQNGARAAQLAVARGGRLVINRGYTNAEANYPRCNPTYHLLAPASVCKALTGMFAAHIFFPNGEMGADEQQLRGIDLPVDVALGLTGLPDTTLQQRLNATKLHNLLDHTAGWPDSFVRAGQQAASDIAALSGGAPPPAPGDMLAFLRTAPGVLTSALTSATGEYDNNYTATSVIALSERLSQRWVTSDEPAQAALFVDRIREWWGPNTKVTQGVYDRAARRDARIFPQHASWLQLVESPLFEQPGVRPEIFQGNHAFDASVGGLWMSAATIVRILSGMDPSSSQPKLLKPEAVQLMLDKDCVALFSVNSRYLHHNGGGPGAAAVAGIRFPGGNAIPQPGFPTTAIAYMENWNDPDLVTGTWNHEDLQEIRFIVEDIEALYGWEEGDLFDLE